ncbi:hypothetical protein NEFER02_2250, partial [Nematocida sp. LUAm2]
SSDVRPVCQAGPDCLTEPFAACFRVPNVHGLILKTSVRVRQNQPGASLLRSRRACPAPSFCVCAATLRPPLRCPALFFSSRTILSSLLPSVRAPPVCLFSFFCTRSPLFSPREAPLCARPGLLRSACLPAGAPRLRPDPPSLCSRQPALLCSSCAARPARPAPRTRSAPACASLPRLSRSSDCLPAFFFLSSFLYFLFLFYFIFSLLFLLSLPVRFLFLFFFRALLRFSRFSPGCMRTLFRARLAAARAPAHALGPCAALPRSSPSPLRPLRSARAQHALRPVRAAALFSALCGLRCSLRGACVRSPALLLCSPVHSFPEGARNSTHTTAMAHCAGCRVGTARAPSRQVPRTRLRTLAGAGFDSAAGGTRSQAAAPGHTAGLRSCPACPPPLSRALLNTLYSTLRFVLFSLFFLRAFSLRRPARMLRSVRPLCARALRGTACGASSLCFVRLLRSCTHALLRALL